MELQGTSTVGAVGARPTTAATARAVVVGAVLLSSAASVATAALLPEVRRLDVPGAVGSSVAPHEYVELLLGLVLVTIGGLVVLRSRAPRYGWVLLAAGTSASVVEVAFEYALLGWYGAPERTLPFEGLAIAVQDGWMVPFVLLVLLVPALFPDGRAVGRWAKPLRLLVWGWAGLFGVYMLTTHAAGNAFEGLADPPTNPMAVVTWRAPFEVVWAVLTLASLVVAVGTVIARWRGAGDDMRQRIKWVLYALFASVVAVLFTTVATALFEAAGLLAGLEPVRPLVMTTAWLMVAVAIGVGVLGHRLYDVDLALNRTIVYGVMTTLVITVYVGAVVGLGRLVAADDLAPSLLATGLVAVAFEPVRRRVQRGVNRVMFGRRDDPMAVLTQLGTVLARSGAPESALRDVASTLAPALRVPGVAVDLLVDRSWRRHVVAGRLPYVTEIVPLVHGGMTVGRMVIGRRSPNDPLDTADHRLLRTVATQAAAVAHSVGLTTDLRRSRELLVQAREEERRRLRRDLHDGLGPSLASQTFALDAIIDRLGDVAPDATGMLEELKRQNKDLVADIRRLVYELRPPALDELGLVGALAAHAGGLAGRSDVTVEVSAHPDPIGALPAAVEVAAYRIATEAMTNVLRHAEADVCRVHVSRDPVELTVRVQDDGIGIGHVTAPGIGLSSMRERAEELGGRCTVERGVTDGTTVLAIIPFANGVDEHPAGSTPTTAMAAGHAG